MESKPAQNIQDTFLNTVRKDKSPITIYLVSGVKLTGKIRSFDKYSVLLENNSQEQLTATLVVGNTRQRRRPSRFRAWMACYGSAGNIDADQHRALLSPARLPISRHRNPLRPKPYHRLVPKGFPVALVPFFPNIAPTNGSPEERLAQLPEQPVSTARRQPAHLAGNPACASRSGCSPPSRWRA